MAFLFIWPQVYICKPIQCVFQPNPSPHPSCPTPSQNHRNKHVATFCNDIPFDYATTTQRVAAALRVAATCCPTNGCRGEGGGVSV